MRSKKKSRKRNFGTKTSSVNADTLSTNAEHTSFDPESKSGTKKTETDYLNSKRQDSLMRHKKNGRYATQKMNGFNKSKNIGKRFPTEENPESLKVFNIIKEPISNNELSHTVSSMTLLYNKKCLKNFLIAIFQLTVYISGGYESVVDLKCVLQDDYEHIFDEAICFSNNSVNILSKPGKQLKMNFESFVQKLIDDMEQKGILYDDKLMYYMITWLNCMSNCCVRTYRYTSTYFAMRMFACAAINLKGNQPDKALLNVINRLFVGVFVHRFRDVCSDVRSICLEFMGFCILENKKHFLNHKYLKYIGYMMNDQIICIRNKSLSFIQDLYTGNFDLLEYDCLSFFGQFYKRVILNLTLESNCYTVLQSLRLAFAFVIHGIINITWDQFDNSDDNYMLFSTIYQLYMIHSQSSENKKFKNEVFQLILMILFHIVNVKHRIIDNGNHEINLDYSFFIENLDNILLGFDKLLVCISKEKFDIDLEKFGEVIIESILCLDQFNHFEVFEKIIHLSTLDNFEKSDSLEIFLLNFMAFIIGKISCHEIDFFHIIEECLIHLLSKFSTEKDKMRVLINIVSIMYSSLSACCCIDSGNHHPHCIQKLHEDITEFETKKNITIKTLRILLKFFEESVETDENVYSDIMNIYYIAENKMNMTDKSELHNIIEKFEECVLDCLRNSEVSFNFEFAQNSIESPQKIDCAKITESSYNLNYLKSLNLYILKLSNILYFYEYHKALVYDTCVWKSCLHFLRDCIKVINEDYICNILNNSVLLMLWTFSTNKFDSEFEKLFNCLLDCMLALHAFCIEEKKISFLHKIYKFYLNARLVFSSSYFVNTSFCSVNCALIDGVLHDYISNELKKLANISDSNQPKYAKNLPDDFDFSDRKAACEGSDSSNLLDSSHNNKDLWNRNLRGYCKLVMMGLFKPSNLNTLIKLGFRCDPIVDIIKDVCTDLCSRDINNFVNNVLFDIMTEEVSSVNAGLSPYFATPHDLNKFCKQLCVILSPTKMKETNYRKAFHKFFRHCIDFAFIPNDDNFKNIIILGCLQFFIKCMPPIDRMGSKTTLCEYFMKKSECLNYSLKKCKHSISFLRLFNKNIKLSYSGDFNKAKSKEDFEISNTEFNGSKLDCSQNNNSIVSGLKDLELKDSELKENTTAVTFIDSDCDEFTMKDLKKTDIGISKTNIISVNERTRRRQNNDILNPETITSIDMNYVNDTDGKNAQKTTNEAHKRSSNNSKTIRRSLRISRLEVSLNNDCIVVSDCSSSP